MLALTNHQPVAFLLLCALPCQGVHELEFPFLATGFPWLGFSYGMPRGCLLHDRLLLSLYLCVCVFVNETRSARVQLAQ